MPKKHLLICFDAFGTLFTPRKPVAQQYSEVARSFGLGGFTDDDIAKSFKNAFKNESKQNPNYGKATGLGAEKWWGNIIHNTFKPYYHQQQQQPPPNLIPSLIHRFHSKEGYTLYPDVLPLLNQLRAQQSSQNNGSRVVIGVITNSDDRTADILTSLGVKVNPLHYRQQQQKQPAPQAGREGEYAVDFTVLSYDVGVEKPDPRIFKGAEEMLVGLLGAADERVVAEEWRKVYVGDEYDKDVVGANGAGWDAVLVDRENAGERKEVEWLDGQQREDGSIFDVFERVKAVGVGGLAKLGEWLPSSTKA